MAINCPYAKTLVHFKKSSTNWIHSATHSTSRSTQSIQYILVKPNAKIYYQLHWINDQTSHMVEEIHCVGFLSKLLETKLPQTLHFKYEQIYSTGVSISLGGNRPSRTGDIRGDIRINFSCDPEIFFSKKKFIWGRAAYMSFV